MGRGDLPDMYDMYAQARGHRPKGECAYISRQITTAHVIYVM